MKNKKIKAKTNILPVGGTFNIEDWRKCSAQDRDYGHKKTYIHHCKPNTPRCNLQII